VVVLGLGKARDQLLHGRAIVIPLASDLTCLTVLVLEHNMPFEADYTWVADKDLASMVKAWECSLARREYRSVEAMKT
jgi:hypothetical protein